MGYGDGYYLIIQLGRVRYSLVWFGTVRSGTVRLGSVWQGSVWHDKVRSGKDAEIKIAT